MTALPLSLCAEVLANTVRNDENIYSINIAVMPTLLLLAGQTYAFLPRLPLSRFGT